MRHIILGSLLVIMSFQPLAAPVKYVCEEGGSLNVDYVTLTQGPDQANLQLTNGDSVTLSQQVAASGVLYANEQWQWHTKGADALLQRVGQDAVLKCHQIDRATILEDKASWMRFVYPSNWDQESVNVTFWSGPDAAMREPGAEYFIGFDYLPREAGMPQAFLGRVLVFPRAAWDWVSKQEGGRRAMFWLRRPHGFLFWPLHNPAPTRRTAWMHIVLKTSSCHPRYGRLGFLYCHLSKEV